MITMSVAAAGVALVAALLSEMAAFARRRAPDHPLGWLFNLAGILTVLIAWYMVDGWGVYGSPGTGWLRWDHGVILFFVAVVPNAAGDLWRWVRRQ